LLTTHHPDFKGLEFADARYPVDAASFVRRWIVELQQRIDSKQPGDASALVDSILDDTDARLRERRLTAVARSPLFGVEFNEGQSVIEFEPGVTLRPLTFDEEAEILATDSFQGARDVQAQHLDAAIYVEKSVPFSTLTAAEVSGNATPDGFESFAREAIKLVVRALHMLKSGSVSEFETTVEYVPAVFPFSGQRSRYYSTESYRVGPMLLDHSDGQPLKQLYAGLKANRSNLRLARAVQRLVDAERRHNKSDSVVDGVTGLELLFLRGGLQLSLNYAAIGELGTRRERVEVVRVALEGRHPVVHGGESEVTPAAVDASKGCLRDALQRFLLGMVKWTGTDDYWKALLD